MQAILGSAIFAVILMIAGGVSFNYAKGETIVGKLFSGVCYFLGTLIGCYIVFALVGGFFWVIAWVGIVIREILQWLIEAMLYPWYWLF